MYRPFRLATIFAVLTSAWAAALAQSALVEPLCTQCGNSVQWAGTVAMSSDGTHVTANGEDLLHPITRCSGPRPCSTAFALTNGDATPMPTIDGYSEGVSTGVANDGTAVGFVYDSKSFDPLSLPVIWSNHSGAKLLTLLAHVEQAQATSINSSGQIIGNGQIPAVNHGLARAIGLVWCSQDAAPKLLPALVAATDPSLNSGVTHARAITDDGYIVGGVGESDGFHPAYWRIDGRCNISMPTLLSSSRGLAWARIGTGQIVGNVYRDSISLGAIWNAGAQTTLEMPAASSLTLNVGSADVLYGFINDPDRSTSRLFARDIRSNGDLTLPVGIADSLRFVTGVGPDGTAIGIGVLQGRLQPVRLKLRAASEAAR